MCASFSGGFERLQLRHKERHLLLYARVANPETIGRDVFFYAFSCPYTIPKPCATT